MARPVFVYHRLHKQTRARSVVLARETVRELQIKFPDYQWEQLQRFALIQDARRKFPAAEALFKKLYTGHSPEAKKRISRAKRGVGNPNYLGIPDERKIRIRATMRSKDRRQVRNPFFGRKHTEDSKAAIARAAKKRHYRWAMEPGGKFRQVSLHFVLPVGWHWGRARYRIVR